MTAHETRRLEVWSMREFNVTAPMVMENVGRSFASFVVRYADLTPASRILVLAGKGTNGSGVLSAARWLRQRGCPVQVAMADAPGKLRDEPKRQLSLFRKWGGTAPAWAPGAAFPQADVILDGILGHGLGDGSRQGTDGLIEGANAHTARRISIDMPSGLDSDTGKPSDPTFRAEATLALGLPRVGVRRAPARKYVGKLFLADVGLPRGLYDDWDLTPEAIFGGADIVSLND